MENYLSGILAGEPVFINIGVREFAESLADAGFEVVHVDWTPPAGGDSEVAALLDKLL
jgi:FdrA protein